VQEGPVKKTMFVGKTKKLGVLGVLSVGGGRALTHFVPTKTRLLSFFYIFSQARVGNNFAVKGPRRCYSPRASQPKSRGKRKI